MTKSMTHRWFPIKATFLLFLLATLPLYGEDPAPATPAGRRPLRKCRPALSQRQPLRHLAKPRLPSKERRSRQLFPFLPQTTRHDI